MCVCVHICMYGHHDENVCVCVPGCIGKGYRGIFRKLRRVHVAMTIFRDGAVSRGAKKCM